MDSIFAIGFLGLLGCVLLLNLFSLPANWIFVGLAILWGTLHADPRHMGLAFFAMLIGLALLGEIIEYIAQGWGAKKYGSTTGGMFAGLICAFIGAILGLPFFMGFGALIGAFAGAWGGCYLFERLRGHSDEEASKAAKGALLGRFLGMVIKCGIGVIMFGMVYHALLPDISPIIQSAPQNSAEDITTL